MALDLADKSGNSNTLTNVNTATEQTTNPPFTPDTSMAVLVAASSQYFTAADSASLSITGNETAQCWVYFASIPISGNFMAFMGKNNTLASARGFIFGLNNNVGTLQLQIRVSADGTTGTSASVSWTPSLSTWYHVAVVYTAAGGTADFYVNGVAQGTQQSGLATSQLDSTSLFYVGAAGLDSGGALFSQFDGVLDEVRVYNIARTSGNIAGDYNGEISSFTNVAAYWPFNAIPSPSATKTGGAFLLNFV